MLLAEDRVKNAASIKAVLRSVALVARYPRPRARGAFVGSALQPQGQSQPVVNLVHEVLGDPSTGTSRCDLFRVNKALT